MNSNTNTPECVIGQLDAQYRMSPMLKLRGTLTYRAAKLAGMLMAKQAKWVREEQPDMSFADACALTGRNIYQWSEQTMMERGEEHEAQGLEDMGLEVSDMYKQLRAMVGYSNKLNMDMLEEIVDPTGKRRMEPGAKFIGVYHSDDTQRESWLNSVRMHAEAKDPLSTGTYAAYVAKIGDERFTIDEEQWTAFNTGDVSLFEAYEDVIVDMILDIGDDECEFHEMSERTQIGLIESMRGKIDSIRAACMKSVKYMRGQAVDKIAEASKISGLVHGMDRQFCDMLDSARYANFVEFMWNYVPNQKDVVASAVKTRRAVMKPYQPIGRVSDVQAQRLNNADDGLDDVLAPIEREPIVVPPLADFPADTSQLDVRVNGVVG